MKSSCSLDLHEVDMPAGLSEPFATEIKALYHRSGEEVSANPLVGFLYELMRDHVPPGVVERIVLNSPTRRIKFSNGYLALYAKDVAYRLQNGKEEA